MTTQRWIRASDHDRESVAEIIRDAYAVGCLDRSELEQRSSLAYCARTLGELRDLTADLPDWLLVHPVPLPHEHCYRYPPHRPGLRWPTGIVLAFGGFCLIVIVAALAWLPPLTIPFALVWLLLASRARSWPFRPSNPPNPPHLSQRGGRPADRGDRRPDGAEHPAR